MKNKLIIGDKGDGKTNECIGHINSFFYEKINTNRVLYIFDFDGSYKHLVDTENDILIDNIDNTNKVIKLSNEKVVVVFDLPILTKATESNVFDIIKAIDKKHKRLKTEALVVIDELWQIYKFADSVGMREQFKKYTSYNSDSLCMVLTDTTHIFNMLDSDLSSNEFLKVKKLYSTHIPRTFKSI